MASVREAIGTEPIKNDDGTYWPSKTAMKVGVPEKTEYTEVTYENSVEGRNFRVLLLCTDEDRLTCDNKLVFKTGNHPTEIFTVVRHLERAGFNVDFVTPSGNRVPLEEFAIPTGDTLTSDLIKKYEEQLEHPLEAQALLDSLDAATRYVAIFIPGGQGALLSVPTSQSAGALLRWFVAQDKFVITICHGPAGLQSMAIGETDAAKFPLAGYELVLFPASGDTLLTAAGYMPGKVPWNYQEGLEAQGLKVRNHIPTGSTHVDRKLISGDGPMAADALGQLVCHTMLDALNPQDKPRASESEPRTPILDEQIIDVTE